MLVTKKGDKNDLVDSEKTPQSYIDVVFELLASTAGTSSSNSLPESLRLLQSQLQVERHQSVVSRQEAEGLRSPCRIQMHTFWCNNKGVWTIATESDLRTIALLL